MRITPTTRLIALLLVVSCLSVPGAARCHGLLTDPACRSAGTPNEDYQFCFQPAGCECDDFPDPGPIMRTYTAGSTIVVALTITQAHTVGDIFRFQLCPPDALTEDCFASGEIATFLNDGQAGQHLYEIELPPGLVCDPCVLRWKWDYGFLSCADVRIMAPDVPIGIGAWGMVKARYR